MIIISLQSGRQGNLCVGDFLQTTFIIISDTLLDSLFSINHSYFSNFVLLGDFNFANPDDLLYNKIEELMDSFALRVEVLVHSPVQVILVQNPGLKAPILNSHPPMPQQSNQSHKCFDAPIGGLATSLYCWSRV